MQKRKMIPWLVGLWLMAAAVLPLTAQQKKPNILVIFGDDVGYFNISAYNLGVMGYQTPNIDRIANEGALFTDYYAQQSCTAGRAAFITGQSPIRTGLLKVGLPGSKLGLQKEDPTIADLLKPQGYMTFQNGKNHLGDRNEFLPTVHGFDEFFGNFYHLNAEEEPENVDYPRNPTFKAEFGPRGVFKCKATATDNPAPVRSALRSLGQADLRRHRPADQETHGDRRRRVPGGHARRHGSRGQGGQAILHLAQHHPHAHLDAPASEVRGHGKREGPLRRGHDAARRQHRRAAEEAR